LKVNRTIFQGQHKRNFSQLKMNYTIFHGPHKRNFHLYIEQSINQSRKTPHRGDAIFVPFSYRFSSRNLYHVLEEIQRFSPLVSLLEFLDSSGVSPVLLGKGKMLNAFMGYYSSQNATSASLLQQAFHEIVNIGRLAHSNVDDSNQCFSNLWVILHSIRTNPAGVEPYLHEVDRVDVFQRWKKANDLIPDDLSRFFRYPPRVAFIRREINRNILNHDAAMKALTSLGWMVHELNFNSSVPFRDQLLGVQNITTLIGYHGAGLSLARVMHPLAAEIQVQGYPCPIEAHSSMKFRRAYAIMPSVKNTLRDDATNNLADRFCAGEGVSAISPDVRDLDAVIDIHLLIDILRANDPVLSQNHSV